MILLSLLSLRVPAAFSTSSATPKCCSSVRWLSSSSPPPLPTAEFPAPTTVKISDPSTLSKRQRFKNVPLDYQLMRYLEDLGLGKSRLDKRRRASDGRQARQMCRYTYIGN